jgi:hypothetical protein
MESRQDLSRRRRLLRHETRRRLTWLDDHSRYALSPASGRGGYNALEHELRRLGAKRKNGKPNHSQTVGTYH